MSESNRKSAIVEKARPYSVSMTEGQFSQARIAAHKLRMSTSRLIQISVRRQLAALVESGEISDAELNGGISESLRNLL